VIEVDGAYHDERRRAEACRDAVLERTAYRLVQIPATLAVSDIERAPERIWFVLVG
jgi:very-short-patch-repair endonuclease